MTENRDRVGTAPAALVLVALTLGSLPSQARGVPLADHPRLADRVSARHIGTPLPEVLRELEGQRGVSLTIPMGSPYGRQRIYLLARDQPVRTLLQDLARSLGATWTARGDGYELVRTVVSENFIRQYRRDQAEERQAVREVQWKRYRTVVQLALEGGTVPVPPGTKPPNNPFGIPTTRDLLPLAACLEEQQLRRVFEAGHAVFRVEPPFVHGEEYIGLGATEMVKAPALSLPVAQLAAAGRQALQTYLQNQMVRNPSLTPRYSAVASGNDLLVHYADYTGEGLFLSLTSSTSDGWAPDLHLVTGADAGDENPASVMNRSLTAPDLEVFRQWMQRKRHAGTFPYRPGMVSGLTADQARRPLALKFDRMPPAAPSTRLWFGEFLAALHTATGKTIVADYFTRPFWAAVPKETPPLGPFLANLATTFGRDVRAEGNSLLFRSTTWPEDEAAEPAPQRVDAWRAARKQRGVLPPESWWELGGLPREQLGVLCLRSELWGEELMTAAQQALRGKPALEFFSQLRPEQRAKAAQGREGRVTWSDLDLRQREAALAWAWRYQGARCTRNTLEKEFHVTLRTGELVREDELRPGQRVTLVWLTVSIPGVGQSAMHRIERAETRRRLE